MKAIIGLGNPGLPYHRSRHNVGFDTVDLLAEHFQTRVNKIRFKSLIGETHHNGEKVVLVKPQTYMNNSGIALLELCRFYRIEPEDLIVIYDDIDIPFGSIRIKKKGSAGSHNGMKSILYHLQSEDFPRVRISIGKKPSYMDLADYVLAKPVGKERDILDREIEMAKKAALLILKENVTTAMNQYNMVRLLEEQED